MKKPALLPLFLVLATFTLTAQSRLQLEFIAHAYSTAPLQVDADYAPRSDVGILPYRSLGLEGKLQLNYRFSEKWYGLLGAGVGGYAYNFDLYAAAEFTGADWDIDGRLAEPEFSYPHSIIDLGLEYRLPLDDRFSLAMAAFLHTGFFLPASVGYGYSIASPPRTVMDWEYDYNPRSKPFVGLKLAPSLKWQFSRYFGLNLYAVKVFSGFHPIKDAAYTLFGAQEMLTGRISQRYEPIGIGVGIMYHLE